MTKYFLAFTLLLINWGLFSQSLQCGTDVMRFQKVPPIYEIQQKKLDEDYAFLIKNKKWQRVRQVYTIPVVVHIIHDNTLGDITDAQVLDGIQYMNDAFANVGAYQTPDGINCEIEFCLAKRDTNDQFTTGINRVQSTLTDMVMETEDLTVKGLIRWNPEKYLNIWLVNAVTSLASGPGVVGYAYFPSSHGQAEDGILMESGYFGTNSSQTSVAVHEVGHYLGLFHTFEGGCGNNDCLLDGDKICDTPPDGSTANVPCASNPNTCNTDEDDISLNNPFRAVALGGLGDQFDMLANHLDYGDTQCHNRFTPNQRDKMVYSLSQIRTSLLSSSGCVTLCPVNLQVGFTMSAQSIYVGNSVNFTNTTLNGGGTYSWFVNGQYVSSNVNYSQTFPSPGTYIINLSDSLAQEGCLDEFQDTVYVICAAQASFTASATQIPIGGNVSFTYTGTGATTYSWYVNGTYLGNTSPIAYTSTNPNGLWVYLVSSNGICTDTSAVMSIQVGDCKSIDRSNYWFFGLDNLVDFSTTPPTASHLISSPPMRTFETSCSAMDANQNLLFYTNGDTAWTKNYTAMPNGFGMGGNPSAAQGATIIPYPGNPDLYYCFGIDAIENNCVGGLKYSIVDMALNGGLGDVTQKAVQLEQPVGEGLCAFIGANASWVIVHGYQNSMVYAYKIDVNGVNLTPVISNLAPYSAFGSQLQISHDGALFVCSDIASPDTTKFHILDFDVVTGLLSNDRLISYPNLTSSYNVTYDWEFSPDNTKLYQGLNYLVQFDLSTPTVSAILGSMTPLSQPGSALGDIFGMELGPDNKIYLSYLYKPYLSCIQNPNASGTLCNFLVNALPLDSIGLTWVGLPNFPRSKRVGIADISFADTTICIGGGDVSLTIPNLEADATLLATASGNISVQSINGATITISPNAIGQGVLIINKYTNCAFASDTVLIDIISSFPVDIGNDTTICAGTSVVLQAPIYPNATYSWNTGSQNNTINATSAGDYSVIIHTPNGCLGTDTVHISQGNPIISLDLGQDKVLCAGEVYYLDASNPLYDSYTWYDNSHLPFATFWLPGTYWLTVTGDCGTMAQDTIHLLPPPPFVQLPLDSTLCYKQTWIVSPIQGNGTYSWNTGEINTSITIQTAGTYMITMTELGCASADTLNVNYFTSPVQLPQDSILCEPQTWLLSPLQGNGTFQWNTGATSSVIPISNSGTYAVTMLEGHCVSSDSMEVSYKIHSIQLPQDSTLCPHQAWHVSPIAVQGEGFFQWNTGTTNQNIIIREPGIYILSLTEGPCVVYDTLSVFYQTIPPISLGADKQICRETDTELSLNILNASYLWFNGSTANEVVVNQEGEYWVEVTLGNCTERTSISINEVDCCNIFVPNVFTPDNQEPNNTFALQASCTLVSYQLTIFDRWGKAIFQSNSINESWNGAYQGKELPEGVYTYKISYLFDENGNKLAKTMGGTVHLLR